eukprot:TRINITY_DN10967_c0_g2_i1.p1 TRINITY_DN10967_c0_g2~~TRINITY_DN10967_c0_g2_i1.p1  ORF type:complete len:203 (+),score=9.51 TRINITY_DN10967_c0_g2_i1:253-861(+)
MKPPRAHHCGECKKCILKMDHHCPWVNNCVGFQNHKYFINFLIYTAIMLTYAGVAFVARLISIFINLSNNAKIRRALRRGGDGDVLDMIPTDIAPLQVVVVIVNLIIIVPLALSLYCLLLYQIDMVCSNMTSIEEYEDRYYKRQAKRKGTKYKWYYDVGKLRNWRQVFGPRWFLWFIPFTSSFAAKSNADGTQWARWDKQEV